jgi:hypothetical protein
MAAFLQLSDADRRGAHLLEAIGVVAGVQGTSAIKAQFML